MPIKKLLLVKLLIPICIIFFALEGIYTTSIQAKETGQNNCKGYSNFASSGNTSGNISNYGYYVAHQNWIYYSNFDDKGKLYKMKTDGTGIQKVIDENAKFINVIGDWIYYISYDDENSCINKIKIDGSSRTSLIEYDRHIKFLNVYEDKIYYILSNNEADVKNYYYSINELKTDGTNVGEVFRFETCSSPQYFYLSGNYGYCLVNKYGGHSYNNAICRLSLDSSNKSTMLVSNAITFNVSEGWIYYGTFNEIRRIKVDGKEDKKITDGFPGGLPDGQWGDPPCLNVDGNWIYYKDWSTQIIYKLDVYGKNKTKLADCIADSINIAGDYLYCPEYQADSSGEFYKYIDIRKIKK
ncbi:DUF5050 domain-containing protein [Clostridium sp. PL3]|uniref:DUF5050 domain-containing protein n=1 Tax=Clostridium thailandense TaxID=2794346 RepID=A0A949U2W9_9CLOT|nr:DUF5050 domain-containing protein [Clostridium thailandense]MBV7275369.1 DUF5050 domain-containing protein [Clostridium thailandense]